VTTGKVIVSALILSASLACSDDSAQLFVVVDSDMVVPGALSLVRAEIRGQDRTILGSHEFSLIGTAAKSGVKQFNLPLSFGVLPPDGDVEARVIVEVSAIKTATAAKPLFTRRALTGFVSNKSLLLPMFLASQCRTLICESGQTCTENGCVSETVDETSLKESNGAPVAQEKSDAGTNSSADAGIFSMPGCTDPEAHNYNANATTDDNSCRYRPSSDIFLDYAKTHYIPGKFPASTCDAITKHHECVSTKECNWLRTIKNNGVCRADPVVRCLSSGECVCRAHDFHGAEALNNDLELFVPLSITWTNLAPQTSAFGGNQEHYATNIDMTEILNESLENYTSRTDFTHKTLNVRASSASRLEGITQAQGMSLALKFMHVWDKDPASMGGTLFEGLGMRLAITDDQLALEFGGNSYPIQGEHPTTGKIKDYQCNQLAIVVSNSGNANVYLGTAVTTIPGLTMNAVRTAQALLSDPLHVLRVGTVNAKIWDLRIYGNNRLLTANGVSTIGKRCGDAGQYEIPSGYPDSNRRYSWGMGGYGIVPGHATQSYSSGVYVTMRIPEPDVFPPTDADYHNNLKRMIGFWDRWHEQMFFELDLIPFVDQRELSPMYAVNSYRNYDESDGLGSRPGEPSNYNNPCRYVTDLFQAFNWLPEDFPGEPTSADHRKIAERGGWTRWNSYEPDTYGSWQRPVHEHGHTAHFTLMRTYQKVHHYIRGIAGESFAEIMSTYVLAGLKSWMNTGLTYYPTVPLAFEGRWDSSSEKHVLKSDQPYQEKNIDDQGLGARFYGLGVWWTYVSHYAAKPYLIGWLSGDNDETPGTTLQKMRFYLAQEGLDLGELFGNYAAHVATWDWPHTGHNFYDQEQEPFQGIENWCTTNSGPNCTVDSLKVQVDVNADLGTEDQWIDGPAGLHPGGFAYSTIRIKNAPAGSVFEIGLDFEVPSKVYSDSDHHIRLTPQCKDDPRFFSSRIVVVDAGSEGQVNRAQRPQYYKIPGRKVDKAVIEISRTSNIYILAIPTPPFELEDVQPFVNGYSLIWPYKYKVSRLTSVPATSNAPSPINLSGDEMLNLTPQEGNGFTYDCFNAH